MKLHVRKDRGLTPGTGNHEPVYCRRIVFTNNTISYSKYDQLNHHVGICLDCMAAIKKAAPQEAGE